VAWTVVVALVALSASFATWSALTSLKVTRVTMASRQSTTLRAPSHTTLPAQTTGFVGTSGVVLASNGLGVVEFGATEAETDAAIAAYLGPPTGDPPSGCVGQWIQLEWNDLIVEFLDGRLIGYRYLLGGYDSTQTAIDRQSTPVPKLATETGISLGSTLGQVKATYPGLVQTGSFAWTSQDGIHFAAYSNSYPSPPSSSITEVKIGTCGDW
jgi:hypothetical protein